MPGIPIAAFLDWAKNTGPQFLSGPESVINSVSRRSFILSKFMKNKPANKVLQGSNKIQETLYLIAKRNFRMFNRGDSQSWPNLQKDELMQLDYRFGLGEIVWDEWEYEGQADGLAGERMYNKYLDEQVSKEQRLWDDMIHGVDDQLFLPPNGATNFAAMESSTGAPNLAFSIPVFVHENSSNNGGFDSNWLTTENVNQATYSLNWDNKRATYDESDPNDNNNNETGIFNAFDSISVDIGYETPGMHDEAFEDGNAYGEEGWTPDEYCIATSKKGRTKLMHLHRTNNDSLITMQDAAHPKPAWNGIPIEDIALLDANKLYIAEDASTYVAEDAAGGTSATNVDKLGPRYYFLNTKYIYTVFHSAKYFKMGNVKEPTDKVGQFIIPVEVWFNLICTGRRWQGLVSPT